MTDRRRNRPAVCLRNSLPWRATFVRRHFGSENAIDRTFEAPQPDGASRARHQIVCVVSDAHD
jgi:hypothetical protein